DRGADAPYTFVDLISRNRRKRQPEMMIAARVGKKRLAEEKRRAIALGNVEQRTRTHFTRRRRPQVKSACGADGTNAGGPMLPNGFVCELTTQQKLFA